MHVLDAENVVDFLLGLPTYLSMPIHLADGDLGATVIVVTFLLFTQPQIDPQIQKCRMKRIQIRICMRRDSLRRTIKVR